MWLDYLPGEDNSADMGTKQFRSVEEFYKKDSVLTGKSPFLFKSVAVVGFADYESAWCSAAYVDFAHQ